MEKFKGLYHQNLPSIKASEGLTSILNQQRNTKLKASLGYEEGSSSDHSSNTNPSSFSKLQSLKTITLQKQRKKINHQKRMKEKVPKLNL
jgi:hypothetical protein